MDWIVSPMKITCWNPNPQWDLRLGDEAYEEVMKLVKSWEWGPDATGLVSL